MATYYNFTAYSAMSFPIVHRGRKIFVNFSLPVNGVARYLTKDKELAEKICKHRWFRQGLIRMTEENENENLAKTAPETPAILPHKPSYSILGKPMSAKIPTFSSPVAPENDDKEDLSEEKTLPEGPAESSMETVGMPITTETVSDDIVTDTDETEEQFTPESVSSFLEAREYLVNRLGIDRELCQNKQAIASICEKYGISFPNYKL